MPRLEGGLHGLKADPSARADDQDCRHGVMLPVGPSWLTRCRQPHRKIRGGSHAASLRWPQNGLAVSRNRPNVSNEGTARRLIEIYSPRLRDVGRTSRNPEA